MKGKVISLLILPVAIFLLAAVFIADNSYPQGKAYRTGGIIEVPVMRESLEYAKMPSPSINPDWVRFFQDRDDLFIVVGIAGLCLSFWCWPKHYKV